MNELVFTRHEDGLIIYIAAAMSSMEEAGNEIVEVKREEAQRRRLREGRDIQLSHAPVWHSSSSLRLGED